MISVRPTCLHIFWKSGFILTGTITIFFKVKKNISCKRTDCFTMEAWFYLLTSLLLLPLPVKQHGLATAYNKTKNKVPDKFIHIVARWAEHLASHEQQETTDELFANRHETSEGEWRIQASVEVSLTSTNTLGTGQGCWDRRRSGLQADQRWEPGEWRRETTTTEINSRKMLFSFHYFVPPCLLCLSAFLLLLWHLTKQNYLKGFLKYICNRRGAWLTLQRRRISCTSVLPSSNLKVFSVGLSIM